MARISMTKKTLGVIGGMGAQASADFYNMIISCTQASTDQDHIDILLYSKSSIPDRSAAIRNGNEKPVTQALQEAYDKLSGAGVDYIAITCNTAHHFLEDIKLNKDTPIIDMIEECANHLKERQIKKVGLMATEGTLSSKVYDKKLLKNGIEVISPSMEKQKLLMQLIYEQIKSGKEPDHSIFQAVANELISQQVELILLGCTELSVYANMMQLGEFYVDAQTILAKKCVSLCGGILKEN